MCMTQKDKFLEKVNKTDSCWLWNAGKTPNGYGHLKVNQVQYLAHRYSWLLHKGEIPDGLCVLHKCDVKECVNPDHLWLGTKGDNWRDCIAKGRHNPGAKGERCWKAKLTTVQVRSIRQRYLVEHNQSALAREFGVTSGTICRIVNNTGWKSII